MGPSHYPLLLLNGAGLLPGVAWRGAHTRVPDPANRPRQLHHHHARAADDAAEAAILASRCGLALSRIRAPAAHRLTAGWSNRQLARFWPWNSRFESLPRSLLACLPACLPSSGGLQARRQRADSSLERSPSSAARAPRSDPDAIRRRACSRSSDRPIDSAAATRPFSTYQMLNSPSSTDPRTIS
jgi:hypothetical protein